MGCGPSEEVKQPVKEEKPKPKTDGIKIVSAKFKDPDVKILTLGAGECGKSTIWRQLKLIYCGGFSEDERNNFKSVIRINVLSDIKTLIESLNRADQNVPPDLVANRDLINELSLSDEELVPDVAQAIFDLWNDPIMKVIYQQSNSIGLGDNADFFLDNVKRIAAPEYVPTNEDILKSRIRTTGIADLKFSIESRHTQLVDVGGQKSERSRWQKCFQGVDFLLFVVSLSDFDQCMFEDEGTKRTEDSMNLFDQIANSNIFVGKPIILILNKKDVFQKKLAASPDKFRESYPGFSGDTGNLDQCVEHVKQAFLARIKQGRAATAWVEAISACAMSEDSIRELFQKIAKKVIELPPKESAATTDA